MDNVTEEAGTFDPQIVVKNIFAILKKLMLEDRFFVYDLSQACRDGQRLLGDSRQVAARLGFVGVDGYVRECMSRIILGLVKGSNPEDLELVPPTLVDE